jgi:hypothetical protein
MKMDSRLRGNDGIGIYTSFRILPYGNDITNPKFTIAKTCNKAINIVLINYSNPRTKNSRAKIYLHPTLKSF